ncbi:MAG: hypothetical protein ACO4B3_09080, partial [Planctomycetota bacterium]
MTSTLPPALAALVAELRRISPIGSALALLGWDQETHMPPQGAGPRAEVLGALTEVHHERSSADALGERIAAAEEEVAGSSQKIVPIQHENGRRRHSWKRTTTTTTTTMTTALVAD